MSPTAEVEVIGSRGSITVTALNDTGFDGELSLPTRIAVPLGLELIGQELVELADGTEKEELVFDGNVRFLDLARTVRTYLSDSDEALIGTGLLGDCRLTIDFVRGRVQIVRETRPGTPRR